MERGEELRAHRGIAEIGARCVVSEHEPVVGHTGLLCIGDRMVMEVMTVTSVTRMAVGTGRDRRGCEQSDHRHGGDSGPSDASRRVVHRLPFGG